MAPRKGTRTSPATEFKPGVRNSPSTEFKPGQEPIYRHPKGHHFCPEKEFKPGNIPCSFKGIGVPVEHRPGEFSVTTEDLVERVSRGKTYRTKKRTSYARFLWEEYYGPVPPGMVVYNNTFPEEPSWENLEVITRAELATRNLARKRLLGGPG